MTRKNSLQLYLFFTVLLALAGLQGCVKQNFNQQELDRQVYDIIEDKWQSDFGSQANYRISDTEALPGDIRIDTELTDYGVLTLPQAVALATANNREYQSQREALYIKALDLKLNQHTFEYQFAGGSSAGYNSEDNDDAIGIESKIGFNRLLAGGTQISTNLALAWFDVLSGNLRGGLSSILSATVTQPLLRGSQRRVVLENLTQAERDTLYQIRSFNRFRQEFVVSVVTRYYTILQLFEMYQNAGRNFITLDLLLERVTDLADAGRASITELDQVRQERLLAQNTYSQAEREYLQALDEFKLMLSLSATTNIQLDNNEFEKLKQTNMTELNYSEDRTVQDALRQRLDVANSADAVIDAERKVLVAEDGMLADLNIIASANAASPNRGDRINLNRLQDEYGIGIEFDLPLDRVAEQSILRKAMITLSQKQREYEETTDMVTLQVRQAYRNMTESAERYKVASEAYELAESRYSKTFLLLQYGRESTRRVLDAQKDFFNAYNDMTEALLDYTIAILNFYRDTGQLQVRPDGMWEL